jgi:hypothetical protein
MPRKRKHPKDMTTDELARYAFHPKVLSALKKHVKELNSEKPARKRLPK